MLYSSEIPYCFAGNTKFCFDVNAQLNEIWTTEQDQQAASSIINMLLGLEWGVFMSCELEYRNIYQKNDLLNNVNNTILHSKTMTNGPEGYIQSLHETSVIGPTKRLVSVANNINHQFQSLDEHSTNFVLSLHNVVVDLSFMAACMTVPFTIAKTPCAEFLSKLSLVTIQCYI